MRKISTARSSRRAPTLKDTDYDHEINLVDHAAEPVTPQPVSPEPPTPRDAGSPPPAAAGPERPPLERFTTALSTAVGSEAGPSTAPRDGSSSRSIATRSRSATSVSTPSLRSKKSKSSLARPSSNRSSGDRPAVPRVHVNGATPLGGPPGPPPRAQTPRQRKSPESDIDVLYENQRGAFLCGIPLFSPKALGQLDPPPWTNVAHKPSPTNIHNAQVPDPSWVWVWPEWRVNRDTGVDEEGWEYSFMFAKAFSWHGRKWYNSFVRRRAWIRKRAKRRDDPNDPHMLNTEYFTIRPSSEAHRPGSKASSHPSHRSVASMSSVGDGAAPLSPKADIEDIETLMAVLGQARIDREKIEAVANFLEHADDGELAHLEHKMHEIMAIFVFQASRRKLLLKLNQAYQQAQEALKENDTGRLQRRCNNLRAAIRHADEELARLEYWSDIKQVMSQGRTEPAKDKCAGWDERAQGGDDCGQGVPKGT